MWDFLKKLLERKVNKVENSKNIVESKFSDEELKLKKSIRLLEKREVHNYDTSFLLKKEYKIDYDNILNEEQKRALFSKEGQYLVIAGAGSGKTRTIVYRTAWLIEEGVPEERIVMITFTRKASEEMEERLKNILELRELKVRVSTFHSFCAQLIYKNQELFGMGEFKILEDGEREKIIALLMKKLPIEKKYKKGFYGVKELSDGLLKVDNKKVKLEAIFTDKDKIADVKFIRSEYNIYKRKKAIYEFDDLIDIVVRKFRENREFLEEIRKEISYLIVDEYQDSNLGQRELLKLLVGENGNIMVVGDDYQSIYGFRGADFTNILKFGDDFPNSKLIKLQYNYRSSDEIIGYSNRIAKNFKIRYNKQIMGTGRKGEKIHKNFFKDERAEAKFICEKILKLSSDIPYEEMAILFRNRYTIKVLEKLLVEYSIPFHKKEEEKKGVAFYTLHSSKGLEWRVVFIPSLLQGIFPSSIDIENIEEEKRLYYVGCSRAKDILYITYPKFHYEKLGYFDKKSEFLNY